MATDWAHKTALYQIYPLSFLDSNGDGFGDLPGIIKKIDYFKGAPDSLGVDALWLSPIFPSAMADFGYDVTDYCDIDPRFGTLADFDTLVHEAHRREIKILLDLVPNHTSNQHPWFLASKNDRNNPKRDWYTWRDPLPDGSPPNNWLSAFDGSAWEFDETTQQYYLHTFLKEQPDLNWQNPAVRQAIQEVMRFWFKRGVDGFRIDAVYWLAKDPQLHDDPPQLQKTTLPPASYDTLQHTASRGQPALFDYLKELAATAKELPGKLLITEAYPDAHADFKEYLQFYQKVDPHVLVPFNFEPIFLSFSGVTFKQSIDAFEALLKDGYMPVYVLGNHDSERLASRFTPEATRLMALLGITLPGLPIIYYGDEIGMVDGTITAKAHRDSLRDAPGRRNRDPSRTPMQWGGGTNAGFSSASPWLPVGEHANTNVASEMNDGTSLWQLYRQLLALRRSSVLLQEGEYGAVTTKDADLFSFKRTRGNQQLTVLLNFSKTRQLDHPIDGQIILSTVQNPQPATLQPLEGRIVA